MCRLERLFKLYNPLMPAPIRYPCFLPVDPRGIGPAPHLIVVDRVTCIVLLTSSAAADGYFARKLGAEAKSRAVVWTFGEPAGLLKYLKELKPPAAGQGAYHVAYDPSPERTVYGSIRELVEELEKEVKPPPW
jgi:hypothetical protein